MLLLHRVEKTRTCKAGGEGAGGEDGYWEKGKESCSERKFPVKGEFLLICKSHPLAFHGCPLFLQLPPPFCISLGYTCVGTQTMSLSFPCSLKEFSGYQRAFFFPPPACKQSKEDNSQFIFERHRQQTYRQEVLSNSK